MALSGVKEIIEDSYEGGQNWFTAFRKYQSLASVAGSVVDFSMASGTPRANYYTGESLTATAFLAKNGIYHGANVSPSIKYLRSFNMFSNNAGVVPVVITLLDYLLFYPLIDMDEVSEQFFTNTVTLPRYTSGLGVQAFLVATNPYIGGGQFFINYTNADGVANCISRLMTINTNGTIGTLIHSGVTANLSGTFINLAPNEKGIRSVQSITFLLPQGGLGALVLCYPIANVLVRNIDCYSEWDFLTMKSGLPRIYDGAYLNMIGAVNGTPAGQYLIGHIETIWN